MTFPSEIIKSTPNRCLQGAPINLRSITHDLDGSPLSYREYLITHKTKYDYQREVEHSVHQFRILPVEDQIQNLLHATLKVSVEGTMFQYDDVFGNGTLYYDIQTPYNELEIIAESRIRLFARPNDDYSSSLRAEPRFL